MSTAADLDYYLNRKPTRDEVEEAAEWQDDNPDTGLAEWVNAMIGIGAL